MFVYVHMCMYVYAFMYVLVYECLLYTSYVLFIFIQFRAGRKTAIMAMHVPQFPLLLLML